MDRSTNFLNWIPFVTNIPPTNGIRIFTDTPPSNHIPAQFYRGRVVQ